MSDLLADAHHCRAHETRTHAELPVTDRGCVAATHPFTLADALARLLQLLSRMHAGYSFRRCVSYPGLIAARTDPKHHATTAAPPPTCLNVRMRARMHMTNSTEAAPRC